MSKEDLLRHLPMRLGFDIGGFASCVSQRHAVGYCRKIHRIQDSELSIFRITETCWSLRSRLGTRGSWRTMADIPSLPADNPLAPYSSSRVQSSARKAPFHLEDSPGKSIRRPLSFSLLSNFAGALSAFASKPTPLLSSLSFDDLVNLPAPQPHALAAHRD
jgi:hypothetical protein